MIAIKVPQLIIDWFTREAISYKPTPDFSEYAWEATVTSTVDPTHVDIHYFANREQARNFKKSQEASMTSPKVTYKQVPFPIEGGWLV